jgi:hypothetical protein
VIYAVLTPEGRARLDAAYPTHLRGVREHFFDHLSGEQCDFIAEALGAVDSASNAACAAAVEAECDAVDIELAGDLVADAP